MIASNNPVVTVLMSVYNGQKYLAEAIESILSQTYDDFEFLIIDDHSSDRSVEIIKSYNDDRIRLVQNNTNIGQTKSLNKGIGLARGEFIARLDQDDMAMSERLEKQMLYMQKHSEIDLLGSWTVKINDNGETVRKFAPPHKAKHIIDYFIIGNPFAHSSVLFKKKSVLSCGCYNESLRYCQDKELWVRMIKHNMDFQIIPDELVKIRLYDDRSTKKSVNQSPIMKEEIITLNEVLNLEALSRIRRFYCRFKTIAYAIFVTFKIYRDHYIYKIVIGVLDFPFMPRRYLFK